MENILCCEDLHLKTTFFFMKITIGIDTFRIAIIVFYRKKTHSSFDITRSHRKSQWKFYIVCFGISTRKYRLFSACMTIRKIYSFVKNYPFLDLCSMLYGLILHFLYIHIYIGIHTYLLKKKKSLYIILSLGKT